jgi:F1F0 ATPase subunit 2
MPTMTSELPTLTGALFAGLLAGTAFFAGLWWTVQRMTTARHPGLLIAGSLLLRTALALGVFFLAGRGHLDRMLACLAGFVIARFLVMRWTRARTPKEDAHATES